MLPANYESRPVTRIQSARRPSTRHLVGAAARFTGPLLAGGLIFAKLDLPPSDDDHRGVLAVLAYLNSNA